MAAVRKPAICRSRCKSYTVIVDEEPRGFLLFFYRSFVGDRYGRVGDGESDGGNDNGGRRDGSERSVMGTNSESMVPSRAQVAQRPHRENNKKVEAQEEKIIKNGGCADVRDPQRPFRCARRVVLTMMRV